MFLFIKNVCIPRSFLVIHVCNQGKSLISPCRFWCWWFKVFTVISASVLCWYYRGDRGCVAGISHTHTHTHTHTRTHSHTRTHTHTLTQTCAHARTHMHSRAHTHTHTHTLTHTHTHTNTHTHIYIYIKPRNRISHWNGICITVQMSKYRKRHSRRAVGVMNTGRDGDVCTV
jgi:hypothetical protein